MSIDPTLLGTSGHGTDGGQTYSAGYRYSNVCLGRCPMFGDPGFTNELYVRQTIHVAGAISNLSWGLDTAFGANLTLTLRAGNPLSNTGLVFSIGGLIAGLVSDNTDHVAVADGDMLDFAAHTGNVTYTGAFQYIACAIAE